MVDEVVPPPVEPRSAEAEAAPEAGSGPGSGSGEARPRFRIKILQNALAPLAHADGSSRGGIGPYKPVLDACTVCSARCCRLNVKLSLGDAIVFCNTLGVPFFAGLLIVPSEHPLHAFKIEKTEGDKRIKTDLLDWTGTGEIALIRREDGACHGVVDVGGHERCGLYSARPSHCRTYPFSWTADEHRGSPGMICCPVPYGVSPAEEQRALADIQRSIELWSLHDEVVAAWNALPDSQPRAVDAFLEFALPITAERLGMSCDGLLTREPLNRRLYAAMVRSGVVRPPRPIGQATTLAPSSATPVGGEGRG